MLNLFTDSGADFSPNRRYRYTLWRTWDSEKPRLNFLMLNPSTADEYQNDPTVERCERRARADGYGGLVVTNLFALRSTDPGALYLAADPIGPENDAAILREAQRAGRVICAWGIHGQHQGRGHQVAAMLLAAGVDLYALRVTGAGEPGHPLYIGYDTSAYLWRGIAKEKQQNTEDPQP